MNSFYDRKPLQCILLVVITSAVLGAILGKLFCEINDYLTQKRYRLECLELKVQSLENCKVLGGYLEKESRLCSGEEIQDLK